MNTTNKRKHRYYLLLLHLQTVYLVWGSTYFFIQKAVHIPPFILVLYVLRPVFCCLLGAF